MLVRRNKRMMAERSFRDHVILLLSIFLVFLFSPIFRMSFIFGRNFNISSSFLMYSLSDIFIPYWIWCSHYRFKYQTWHHLKHYPKIANFTAIAFMAKTLPLELPERIIFLDLIKLDAWNVCEKSIISLLDPVFMEFYTL